MIKQESKVCSVIFAILTLDLILLAVRILSKCFSQIGHSNSLLQEYLILTQPLMSDSGIHRRFKTNLKEKLSQFQTRNINITFNFMKKLSV